MKKPLKFHQTLNLPPRSMKNHGQHRRPGKKGNSHSADGAGAGSRGAAQDTFAAVQYSLQTINPISATDQGAGPDLIRQSFDKMIEELVLYGSVPAKTFGWGVSYGEEKKVPHAGIRVGEIIAPRLWWLVLEDGEPRLSSIAHRQVWKPGETVTGDIDSVARHYDYFSTTSWAASTHSLTTPST